ncbi:MAG: cupredoxin domain-containing protein, partial [Thermoplasmatota archaeon]
APAAGAGCRTFELKSIDDPGKCPGGKAPCWDTTLLMVQPGDKVTINVDLSSGTHNFAIADLKVTSGSPDSGTHVVSFTVPSGFSAPIKYICEVHPTTMIGQIVPPGFTGGGAGPLSIPDLGVKFLSYWVGVIAFAAMFVMYGATFFLFKYNESNATTDHKDRPAASTIATPGGVAMVEMSGDAVTVGFGIIIVLLVLSIVAVALGLIKV